MPNPYYENVHPDRNAAGKKKIEPSSAAGAKDVSFAQQPHAFKSELPTKVQTPS